MMVQKDLNGHLDRVNLLIQLTHGQGHSTSGPFENFEPLHSTNLFIHGTCGVLNHRLAASPLQARYATL